MEFSHSLFLPRLDFLKAVFLALCFFWFSSMIMPGVGLMVRVVGLGSSDPEFKSHSLLNYYQVGLPVILPRLSK